MRKFDQRGIFLLYHKKFGVFPKKISDIATNTFDGNGNFSFINSPDPSLPQIFYLLKLQ